MQINDGNSTVRASAIIQSIKVASFLQIVFVQIQSSGNLLNTNAFLDSGPTFLLIRKKMQEKLLAQGTDRTLSIADLIRTRDLKTEKFPLKIKGLISKVNSIEALAHASISLVITYYDYSQLKQSFNLFSVLSSRSLLLMGFDIILG